MLRECLRDRIGVPGGVPESRPGKRQHVGAVELRSLPQSHQDGRGRRVRHGQRLTEKLSALRIHQRCERHVFELRRQDDDQLLRIETGQQRLDEHEVEIAGCVGVEDRTSRRQVLLEAAGDIAEDRRRCIVRLHVHPLRPDVPDDEAWVVKEVVDEIEAVGSRQRRSWSSDAGGASTNSNMRGASCRMRARTASYCAAAAFTASVLARRERRLIRRAGSRELRVETPLGVGRQLHGR